MKNMKKKSFSPPPLVESTGMKFRYECARANTPQGRKRGKCQCETQSSACLCAYRLTVNCQFSSDD